MRVFSSLLFLALTFAFVSGTDANNGHGQRAFALQDPGCAVPAPVVPAQAVFFQPAQAFAVQSFAAPAYGVGLAPAFLNVGVGHALRFNRGFGLNVGVGRGVGIGRGRDFFRGPRGNVGKGRAFIR